MFLNWKIENLKVADTEVPSMVNLPAAPQVPVLLSKPKNIFVPWKCRTCREWSEKFPNINQILFQTTPVPVDSPVFQESTEIDPTRCAMHNWTSPFPEVRNRKGVESGLGWLAGWLPFLRWEKVSKSQKRLMGTFGNSGFYTSSSRMSQILKQMHWEILFLWGVVKDCSG